MKKIFLFLLFLTACQGEENKALIPEAKPLQEEPVERRNEVVVQVSDSISSFFTNLFTSEFQDKPDMIYLGEAHNRPSITIPTKQVTTIRGGDPMVGFFYELVLESGDSLVIDLYTLQVGADKTVVYPIFDILNGGTPWSETNFDFLLYKKNIDEQTIGIGVNPQRSGFHYNAKGVFENALVLLDKLKQQGDISETFYTRKKYDVQLEFRKNQIWSMMRKKETLDVDSFNIPTDDDLQFDNENYISYLRALIQYKNFRKEGRVPNVRAFDFVLANEQLWSEKVRLALLNSYLKSILFVEKPQFNTYLEKFKAVNTNSDYASKWEGLLSDLNKDKERFNQSNRNIGTLTNLVDDSAVTFEEVLAKQKGKLVLVDFWASWCAPCREEMPSLKALKGTFAESELVVIEISIDKQYNAWEKAARMEGLAPEKYNYLISNWEKTALYKNYEIKTIPRYLLFDQAGQIIDSDAPRPSDNALVELIKANI